MRKEELSPPQRFVWYMIGPLFISITYLVAAYLLLTATPYEAAVLVGAIIFSYGIGYTDHKNKLT
tara:strand:+ start:1678 stop:1872 length:195 start_codon:yes stop_codon:yes gene_type:complete